jgi:hypothetical protein
MIFHKPQVNDPGQPAWNPRVIPRVELTGPPVLTARHQSLRPSMRSPKVAATEYHHGDMNIAEQQKTFHGFMRMVVWNSALLILTLVFLTLHFTTVGLGWFASLAVTVVLGVLIGLGLRMKGAWYVVLFALTAFMIFVGAIAAIISAFLH